MYVCMFVCLCVYVCMSIRQSHEKLKVKYCEGQGQILCFSTCWAKAKYSTSSILEPAQPKNGTNPLMTDSMCVVAPNSKCN